MKNPPQEGLDKSVLQDLRRKIVAWDYPPDFQLIEESLCSIYGVSRSPIRQALSYLVAEGLVVHLPRKGFRVKQLHLKEIEELYEFRCALETHIVKGLAARGLPQDVYEQLYLTWSSIERKQSLTCSELAQLDEDFHTSLAIAYGNQLLISEINAINERIFVFRELDFKSEGRIEETQIEHLKILERLVARDSLGVENILQRNLFSGLGNVEKGVMHLISKSYL
ncbi:GntR family transcriptional regulator [Gammaproteobacteria bacterium]|nr:GntR family transcriptional regulator [Gammaproteobacteria bacterium]